MVLLLQKIGGSTWNGELFMQLIVSMQYVLEKLLDPEIAFKIDTGEDLVMIQVCFLSSSFTNKVNAGDVVGEWLDA